MTGQKRCNTIQEWKSKRKRKIAKVLLLHSFTLQFSSPETNFFLLSSRIHGIFSIVRIITHRNVVVDDDDNHHHRHSYPNRIFRIVLLLKDISRLFCDQKIMQIFGCPLKKANYGSYSFHSTRAMWIATSNIHISFIGIKLYKSIFVSSRVFVCVHFFNGTQLLEER